MKGKIKRLFLCLTAAALLTVSGNAYADSSEDDITIPEQTEETDTKPADAKRKESVENVTASAEHIKTYLKKIGEADGFEVYLKDKDFDDELWEAVGGKPKKKSEYTDEQKKADETVSELKKLGELTAVDKKTGAPAATFKKGSKSDEGLMYISDGGRFMLTVSEDKSKVLSIRQVISTIDEPCLFRSSDKKELFLTDRKLTKITSSYRFKGREDDKTVYTSSADGSFVWLSADEKQVLGVFRRHAENENYSMIVDDRYANIGIENKKTGYIWWSSPLGAGRDRLATPLVTDDMRSSLKLRYGVPASRSVNNVLRSGGNECDIKVTDTANGIKAVYTFSSAGFTVPVEYALEEDCLKASVKVSGIKETNSANLATELTIMSSFGAGGENEEGYFVIPDGSGALVRFNNGKTMDVNAYSQRVYGPDCTAVPTTRGAVTEQIYMPVYGIVKEDNALLTVASGGDTNAYITAQTSGQSNTTYNFCNFTFIMRSSDTFYMSGNNSDKLTVFESGPIKSDDIELRYYPITAEDADYTDVAECYRNYLINEEHITPCAEENSSPLYVKLLGGVQKKKPVLGIPVNMKQSVTDFGEAEAILSELKEKGADSITAEYDNWTDDGICSKIDTSAKPSSVLGGNREFTSLINYASANGIRLYPSADYRCFYSGNGYNSFGDTAVRVSGSYSRIVSYDKAYGVPDGARKNLSLLSPVSFGKVYGETAENYSAAGLEGVSIGDMAASLYGDYGRNSISRAKCAELLEESCEILSKFLENGILAENANAFLFPYVSCITDVPMSSSRFDIFNEDVPFYQIVMHGLIPYTTEAVNGDPDRDRLLLMAAATGSSLKYDLLSSETSELKDTEYDIYYYAASSAHTDHAAESYRLLSPLLKKVSGCTIEDYKTENGGDLITTVYSDGTKVVTDLEAKTVTYDGNTISLSSKEVK